MNWETLISDSDAYTDVAKRVLWFARIEAVDSRSVAVEPAHLILGLLRERKSLFPIRPMCKTAAATIRERLLENVASAGEKSYLTFLDLTPESQAVLADAKAAADATMRAVDVQDILTSVLRHSGAGAWDALTRSGVEIKSLMRSD